MNHLNINHFLRNPKNLISKKIRLFSIIYLFFIGVISGCSPPNILEKDQNLITANLNDYKRAEEFLSVNVNHLVTDLIKKRYWGENDQFVYQKVTADDLVTVVADPRNGNKSFKASFKEPNTKNNKEHLSPDGTKAAFIVDYNLWVRDTRNNNITQLTFDGTEHYGYATNNAGWVRDDRPVLLWSPDSKKIATFRHDSRNVGEMYLVSTKVGHPELDAWKYPLPGDDSIFMIERIILHLDDEPRMVKLNMPPDPHRSSTGDHVADRQGRFIDVEWNAQSDLLAFVSSSRDHKSAKLRLADPETGEIRDIYNETVATYYESGFINPNWRILHHRNEFIWYSEKDNWAHLYLHDLQTGKIKKQLTSGDWSV